MQFRFVPITLVMAFSLFLLIYNQSQYKSAIVEQSNKMPFSNLNPQNMVLRQLAFHLLSCGRLLTKMTNTPIPLSD